MIPTIPQIPLTQPPQFGFPAYALPGRPDEFLPPGQLSGAVKMGGLSLCLPKQGLTRAVLIETLAFREAMTKRAAELTRSTVTLVSEDGDSVAVDVEVPATESDQRRGLMFREAVPEGTGMLFPFPHERLASFWMKNVPVPLDMIFIDRGLNIVKVVHSAKPMDESPHGSEVPVIAVMEVPGGFCRKHGIDAGGRVLMGE